MQLKTYAHEKAHPYENHESTESFRLRALNLSLGLLINFNVPLLKKGIKRVVWSSKFGGLGDLMVPNEEFPF